MSAKNRVALSVALGLALLMGLAVLYSNPPEGASYYPPCLLHHYTGLNCPGCGSTRCVYALLHFRLGEALQKNALAVVALPFLVVSSTRQWWRWLGGTPKPVPVPQRPWLALSIAIGVILFGILRNLPWEPFTLLAPH